MEIKKSTYGDVEGLANDDLIAIARDKCPLLVNGSIGVDIYCNDCEYSLFCIDWHAQNTVLATRLEREEKKIEELEKLIKKYIRGEKA